MSTQPRLQPTRRTVLRSAAWSTAAVTVVVATPNIAAASPGSIVAPQATVGIGTPEKYSVQNTKFVAWDLTVRADNMDLSGLTLQFTYNQTGGGGASTLDEVVVRNYTPAGSWSSSVTKSSMIATATSTTAVVVTKGTTANIHVQFRGSDNSSGQVSVTALAKNSAGNLVAIGGTPTPINWGSGSLHSH